MTTIIEDDDHNGFYSVYANTTVSTENIDEAEVRCEIFYSDHNIVHPPYVDVTTFIPTGIQFLFVKSKGTNKMWQVNRF